MEWLNGPWVIGIGGGILSGLIVTAVSRWLFSGKDHREHLSKVDAANREVVYAIRQSIPESRVPTRNIVDALIASTARKYLLSQSDLNRPEDVAADLVKEVMDSSFISAEKKDEYCSALLEALTQKKPENNDSSRNALASRNITDQQRAKIIWMMSVTLGLTAGGMSAAMALVLRENDRAFQQSTVILLPAAVSLSAAIIAMLVSQLRRYKRRVMVADAITRKLIEESREPFPDISRVFSMRRRPDSTATKS